MNIGTLINAADTDDTQCYLFHAAIIQKNYGSKGIGRVWGNFEDL